MLYITSSGCSQTTGDGCVKLDLEIWDQLFKTNDVHSYRIIKTLIIKYGIYAEILLKKCE